MSKKSLTETHSRTVAKTISWRIVATLTTMTIVFIFTKNEAVSLGVGFFEVIFKLLFYYLHERGWQKVRWGKKAHPLESIPLNKELDPEDRDKVEGLLKNLGYLD